MLITADQIRRIAKSKPDPSNMRSAIDAINNYGARFGLDAPHRLAHFLAQEMHESGAFRYDKEIWGPTAAQTRYDTRVDLGNSPEKDGDGKLYAGRGPIQTTGKRNYTKLYTWALRHFSALTPPNFVKNPSALNTDPWEGLSAIWYWDEGNPTGKSLNRYADENNIEMITRRINGGLNGYADRLSYYDRTALVLLGFPSNGVLQFQRDAQKKGYLPKNDAKKKYDDGLSGPQTRAAMHRALVALADVKRVPITEETKASPIVEKEVEIKVEEKEVEKPTVPHSVEAQVDKKSNLWKKIISVFGVASTGASTIVGADWTTIAAIGGISIAALVVILLLQNQIISAVKKIRAATEG